MLGQTAAVLHDDVHAGMLYELLLPFADRNLTIGPVFTYGCVARYLGLLAATIGRTDDAARHFEAALAANTRMGATNQVANTQLEYAEFLLARDASAHRGRALDLLNRALETAQALGMRPVVERALAAKLRAQGLDLGTASMSDRKSTRLNSSHIQKSRMPSSA